MCELTPPTAGWDTAPLPADTSREADIARVRCFMNTEIGHAEQACVSDAEYIRYWGNIRDVLTRLGGADYGDVIDKIKNEKTDPDTEKHYKVLFKQWKENEDRIIYKMNQLDISLKSSRDEDKF